MQREGSRRTKDVTGQGQLQGVALLDGRVGITGRDWLVLQVQKGKPNSFVRDSIISHVTGKCLQRSQFSQPREKDKAEYRHRGNGNDR